jgi:membrane-bound serine protease (ClpP class)
LVSFFTDPQTTYMLFMGSLALLYYEITHPGLMVPGVVGAAGLIMSLVSLHKLDVTWGGLLLLLLGVALMIAELFVAGFGILGVGGIACFVVGSMILFDPARTGVGLPLGLIIPTSVGLGLIMLLITFLAVKTRQVKKRGGFDDLMGLQGKVVEVNPQDPREGQIEVAGEIWHFRSDHPAQLGESLKIIGHTGLTVQTERPKEQ